MAELGKAMNSLKNNKISNKLLWYFPTYYVLKIVFEI